MIVKAVKRFPFKFILNNHPNVWARVTKSIGHIRYSSSKCTPCSEKPQHTCDSPIVDKCDIFEISHRPNSKLYRNLSLCMLPFIGALAFHVFSSSHDEPDPHYVPYEYMYRRSKRFPWDDGRRSYFHGPYNLIPEEETYHPENVPNAVEKNLKRRKELRDQHAKEELKKRRARHDRGE
ncbi:uncharacterized protein LOC142234094 [Haematobia irritans]|uniref:uncharacterized protein LOC142234094 n=1 Tax=Haematobia irritans TaxID=7368 RepID=UPI003F508737